jgi:transposase InsO family protein
MPPRSITFDHGTEFQSGALEDRAYRRGVRLDFTRSGRRTENAFIASFNGRLPDECLNVNQCTHQRVQRRHSLGEVVLMAEQFSQLPERRAKGVQFRPRHRGPWR